MKRLLRFLSIALLTPCLITPAYAQATAPASWPQSSDLKMGLELLTDTNGVYVDSYVKNLMSDLKRHWLPLVKEAANQRPIKPEETTIEFTIGSDGSILAMQLEDSTHDSPFDKAAWSATKGDDLFATTGRNERPESKSADSFRGQLVSARAQAKRQPCGLPRRLLRVRSGVDAALLGGVGYAVDG